MSSPGGCFGFFHAAFNSRRQFFRQHVVTAYDCPHIAREQIDAQILKFGREHPLIQSMIFGEFMTGDADGCVIPLAFVERNLACPPAFVDGAVAAFVDFSAGGDETVLAVRRGNRVEIVAAFREPDTMKTIGRLIQLFRSHELTPAQISGDAGGLGLPMLDRLRESGWPIQGINNGSPARKPEAYCNIAAETWFEARVKIEKGEIILPNDAELVAQLTSRRGWPDSKGRLQLESKADMRSRGLSSPDRADAVLGTTAKLSSGWTAETLKQVLIGQPAGICYGCPRSARAICDFEINDNQLFPPLVRTQIGFVSFPVCPRMAMRCCRFAEGFARDQELTAAADGGII